MMRFFEFIRMIDHLDHLLEFLSKCKVIHREVTCPQCNNIVEVKLIGLSLILKCEEKNSYHDRNCDFGTKSSKSALFKTRFSHSYLGLKKVCYFISYFLLFHPGDQNFPNMIMVELDMSFKTVQKWIKFCRKILYRWLMKNNEKFGGEKVIIEIDETKFGEYTNNIGQLVMGQWVLGGYERTSNRFFIIPIANRTTTTLEQVIQRKITPGSIVHTDCWWGYRRLQTFNNYQHHAVNYGERIGTLETGYHIENIRRLWCKIRADIQRNEIKRQDINYYLAEYYFKRQFDYLDRIESFFKIMATY